MTNIGPRTRRYSPTSAEVRIADVLAAMEYRIKALEHRPANIPILESDPAEDSGYNIWMFPDGRLRVRLATDTSTNPVTYTIVEFASVGSPGGSINTGAAVEDLPAAPTTKVGMYEATWSQTYDDGGTQRSDIPDKLAFGNQNSEFGSSRSLIGFDYSTIASDLTSSTVLSVSLTVQALDSTNDVMIPFLGLHAFSTKPTTWDGTGIPYSNIYSTSVLRNQLQEIYLPLTFATYIRGSSAYGVAIQSVYSDQYNAGLLYGYGSTYTKPTLNITYVSY